MPADGGEDLPGARGPRAGGRGDLLSRRAGDRRYRAGEDGPGGMSTLEHDVEHHVTGEESRMFPRGGNRPGTRSRLAQRLARSATPSRPVASASAARPTASGTARAPRSGGSTVRSAPATPVSGRPASV